MLRNCGDELELQVCSPEDEESSKITVVLNKEEGKLGRRIEQETDGMHVHVLHIHYTLYIMYVHVHVIKPCMYMYMCVTYTLYIVHNVYMCVTLLYIMLCY